MFITARIIASLEDKGCKRIWKEKGMRTSADWLRYYNNLDVVPFIEAVWKQCEGDIFANGVSLTYLLRGTLN